MEGDARSGERGGVRGGERGNHVFSTGREEVADDGKRCVQPLDVAVAFAKLRERSGERGRCVNATRGAGGLREALGFSQSFLFVRRAWTVSPRGGLGGNWSGSRGGPEKKGDLGGLREALGFSQGGPFVWRERR